jgi:hypothetical protein
LTDTEQGAENFIANNKALKKVIQTANLPEDLNELEAEKYCKPLESFGDFRTNTPSLSDAADLSEQACDIDVLTESQKGMRKWLF